jgi:hypothetical protein
MSRIVFYRITFLILISYSFLSAELLKPTVGGEEKEILKIAGKRRLYTVVKKEAVVYQVHGPARIELIARYPSPKKSKKSQVFSYQITVDDENPININHKYKIQKSIRSVQHPSHYYTYSGNYFINIGEGDHSLTFSAQGEHKYPVLLRVIKKYFETAKKGKRELQPMVFQSNRKVVVDGKEVSYFELNNGRPLQVAMNGPKKLRILSRLIFESRMGEEESYRIRVKSESKVLGTYFISTEQSSEATLKHMTDKVPGKWRTCEIDIPKGNQVISIELVEKDRTVLTRFQEYK